MPGMPAERTPTDQTRHTRISVPHSGRTGVHAGCHTPDGQRCTNMAVVDGVRRQGQARAWVQVCAPSKMQRRPDRLTIVSERMNRCPLGSKRHYDSQVSPRPRSDMLAAASLQRLAGRSCCRADARDGDPRTDQCVPRLVLDRHGHAHIGTHPHAPAHALATWRWLQVRSSFNALPALHQHSTARFTVEGLT